MYQPATRVLTVLELLQTHTELSSLELARRLEVSQRSVRRYILMLQDLGIPVEGRPGPHGGYRLRPGYKLPPLMLTNEEAFAATLGLLALDRLGLAGNESATEGAMAKIDRVLPDTVRDQVRWMQNALVLDEPQPAKSTHSETVMTISRAIQEHRQVWVRYNAPRGETARVIDPYGLVSRYGRWYVIGWCHLREDVRVFRLDRITKWRLLSSEFAKPDESNARDLVRRVLDEHFAEQPEVEVVLHTDLENARRWIPVIMATLNETSDGVLMTCNTGSVEWMAHYLVGLPWRLTIRKPPALITALERLSSRISSIGYDPPAHVETEDSADCGRRFTP